MTALPAHTKHTGQAVPAAALFSHEISFEMLSTAEGSPRRAAAFRACIPHGYTSDGRRSNVLFVFGSR